MDDPILNIACACMVRSSFENSLVHACMVYMQQLRIQNIITKHAVCIHRNRLSSGEQAAKLHEYTEHLTSNYKPHFSLGRHQLEQLSMLSSNSLVWLDSTREDSAGSPDEVSGKHLPGRCFVQLQLDCIICCQNDILSNDILDKLLVET